MQMITFFLRKEGLLMSIYDCCPVPQKRRPVANLATVSRSIKLNVRRRSADSPQRPAVLRTGKKHTFYICTHCW